MKFLKITLCCIMIIAVFSLNSFALSSSTYADLSQSSSTVQNLISYANNYDDFISDNDIKETLNLNNSGESINKDWYKIFNDNDLNTLIQHAQKTNCRIAENTSD